MAAKRKAVLLKQGGDYYFLRPEILAAAKVPKGLHSKLQEGINAAQGAKATDARGVTVVGRFQIARVAEEKPEIASPARRGIAVESRMKRPPRPPKGTIMCPW